MRVPRKKLNGTLFFKAQTRPESQTGDVVPLPTLAPEAGALAGPWAGNIHGDQARRRPAVRFQGSP